MRKRFFFFAQTNEEEGQNRKVREAFSSLRRREERAASKAKENYLSLPFSTHVLGHPRRAALGPGRGLAPEPPGRFQSGESGNDEGVFV